MEFNRTWLKEEEADGLAAHSSSIPVHTNSRVTTPDRSSENTDSESRDFSIRGVPAATSASIMVSEGDLLQPERIENGIVFNVVRREALNQIQRSSSDESEQRRSSSPEADVENLQMECEDASSVSEYAEEQEGVSECTDRSASDSRCGHPAMDECNWQE